MLAHLCMHPKGTFFAFPHPAMIGPNYLAGQVEAGIYLKKDKKRCAIFCGIRRGAFRAEGSNADDVWE